MRSNTSSIKSSPVYAFAASSVVHSVGIGALLLLLRPKTVSISPPSCPDDIPPAGHELMSRNLPTSADGSQPIAVPRARLMQLNRERQGVVVHSFGRGCPACSLTSDEHACWHAAKPSCDRSTLRSLQAFRTPSSAGSRTVPACPATLIGWSRRTRMSATLRPSRCGRLPYSAGTSSRTYSWSRSCSIYRGSTP